MITYKGTNGDDYAINAKLGTGWSILRDSSARNPDGSRVGWTVVGEAMTWREAALDCNERHGTAIAVVEHVDKGPRVVSMDAGSALAFFGFSPWTHEAVDLGPPAEPSRWRPGARRWEIRPLTREGAR